MLLKTLENYTNPYPRKDLVHKQTKVIQKLCANYLYIIKIHRTLIHIPTTPTTMTSIIFN